jgi:putative transcriptional regulator
MMNKNREILLMDYAAGTLDTAHSILVASYLTLSPEGRRYVSECEALGGALMEHMCECAEMSNTCLDAVLAKIEKTPEEICTESSECIRSCIQGCAPLPQPLSRFLPANAAKPQKWCRASGGMEWIDLAFEDGRSRTKIIRCQPGYSLPHHTHRGTEITLVLDGAFEDITGRYQRGDLIIMEAETEHRPVADKRAGCLLISVAEAPMRFTGKFTRFLNQFIR